MFRIFLFFFVFQFLSHQFNFLFFPLIDFLKSLMQRLLHNFCLIDLGVFDFGHFLLNFDDSHLIDIQLFSVVVVMESLH